MKIFILSEYFTIICNILYCTHRYQEIFEEIVDEMASKINLSVDFVAANIASALYEISYLKAREQLESVARKRHEKNKIQKIQNTRNINFSQKSTNVVKNDFNLRKNSTNGNSCITVNERNELAITVKSVSRCLRVCWSVCGDTLHIMKKGRKKTRVIETKRHSITIITIIIRTIIVIIIIIITVMMITITMSSTHMYHLTIDIPQLTGRL